MWYHTHINSLFYVIGNCCNVVEVNQEFARQILVAFVAEQTLFYLLEERQEITKKKRNKNL